MNISLNRSAFIGKSGRHLARTISLTLTASLLFSGFSFFAIPPAQAVSVGNGTCVSDANSNLGVVVAPSGGYCYVAFTNAGSNSWTAPSGVNSAHFLIIAGGGAGGGGAWGGGGGAGEVVYNTNYSVSSSSALSLNVGIGGTPGAADMDPAKNRSNPGGNSWIASSSGVVAQGGGSGASYAYGSAAIYSVGQDGGSGGGGTENFYTNTGGTSTKTSSGTRTGYGNNGGRGGPGGSTQSGGGGGGAGGVGDASGTAVGGAGGSGTALFSTWLAAINSGMSGITGWQTATSSGFIAGGGGGGTTTTRGAAGSGGGGRGGSNSDFFNGESAIASTGSGGGGSGYGGSAKIGGTGGSGLIIIRYTPDGTAPTFSSSSSFSAAENIATSATAATIRVSESATVTISSGADAARFNIARSETDTAIVKFNASPDFEAPADVGGNNIYEITLTATDAASNAGTQSITITVTNVVDTSGFNSLALAGSVTTATYRTVVVITANVSVSSRVTFKVNGKVLPGCKNRLASGSSSSFSATCNWRPSNRGTVSLTAAATPTGAGISSATSDPVSILVGRRVGAR